VTGGYVCGVQFFGGLCGGPSICLGDGIVLDVCCIGCWCIAGVCNCVRVSVVVVCDTVFHIWYVGDCVFSFLMCF